MDIYEKIQMLVLKDIDDKIQKYADKSKFSVAQVPAHVHNGVDSFEIISHWNFLGTESGNNILVPANTNFIICESNTGTNAQNISSRGVVILSKNKLTSTFTTVDTTAGVLLSFTATWNLTTNIVTTGLSGTFHFYN